MMFTHDLLVYHMLINEVLRLKLMILF